MRLSFCWTIILTSQSSPVHYFFFLMIRQPPRSTLFPTRRSSDLYGLPPDPVVTTRDLPEMWTNMLAAAGALLARSEEHTSELQSPVHLVCRLLLEKKNAIYNASSSPASAFSP